MNKLTLSLIAVTMSTGFASLAQAEKTRADEGRAVPRVLQPKPENSSTGQVADTVTPPNVRADVKADARASVRPAPPPVNQATTPKPKSTRDRAAVRDEARASVHPTPLPTNQTTTPVPMSNSTRADVKAHDAANPVPAVK